jgi:hypothetical protein
MHMTLSAFIAHINAPAAARAAADPNVCVFLLCDDVEMWNERGVTTPEELDCYLMRGEISDRFKSLHGFRPRFMGLNTMTADELMAELADIRDEEEAEWEWEKIHKAEEDARIEAICRAQGIDRATFDRWQAEAEGSVFEAVVEEKYDWMEVA